jgi:hypothetical protein
MKKYLDHIMQKEPHHRRQHAMQIAGVITAMVFGVWITTLGLRLGGTPNVAQDDSNQTSLSAATAASEATGQNQLYVASTTGF